MITARKLRDAAIAVLLAIPTLSMTRPATNEANVDRQSVSTAVVKPVIATMPIDQRRALLPHGG